ncbi:RNA pyrophosphohydrolase [Profundibacterium mesophilum]|uniref:RNA pyrophosphohydrolase n=1 Tax=Profundibacterium mesophilum KAUST100406-0324 TaxID=1037889 RepID=A0A921NXR0_9RHOB|nr:RNA pyrophosphohydrolase [Profundibacterium mesophilum]KAF0677291.1 RNA pyrophosphohydrolase [Profundibacterium mesophilum KAUST100406-0324]
MASPADPADLPYRPCAGVMLVNPVGLIFAGERIDTPGAWQMPQGGIDPGETPREAALRELEEETGVRRGRVRIEAESPDWITYELPPELLGKLWGGRYRGQKQRWFLMRFDGSDDEVDIDRPHPEFSAWDWLPADRLLQSIVPFKREVYMQVLNTFSPKL